jgi:hypothetical protein
VDGEGVPLAGLVPDVRPGWGVAVERGVTARAPSGSASGMPRLGKTSRMGRVAAGVVTGSGVGVGRAATTSSSSPSARPGRGRTALELTGPPARLTLTSPP